MTDIKWIKIVVNMFEDSKIEFIRSLPEGDSIIVTWIQMMSIAGQSNMGGYLMVTEELPYTEQFLATKLKRSPVFLQFALETLCKLKMINIEDGPYHITNWEKYQNVDGMERIKLQNKERKRLQREREKQALIEEKTSMSRISHVTVTEKVTHDVTHCHATDIDIDKELKHKTITKKPVPKREYAEDVFLAESEYAKLLEKYGEQLTLKAIEILSSYKGAKGAKYKSDYKAMLNWVFDEAAKRSNLSISESRTSIPKYSAKDREAELLQKAIQNSKSGQVSMIDFGPRID